MLKTRKVICLFSILFLLLSSVCMATNAEPATQEKDDVLDLPFISTDLYLASNNDTVIDKPVDGNVFLYGQNVTIKSDILGDLFVLANNLTIENTATISGNVFAYASNLTVDGKVTDIYALSQNFTLNETANIYRDLKLYTDNCTINGFVEKDAYIAANTINFKDNTEGLVKGNFNYTSGTEANIPENAIAGKTNFTQLKNEQLSVNEIIRNYIISFVNVFVYAVVVILLIVKLAPKAADKLTYCLSKRPFITAGVGILGVILIPIIAILALLTGLLLYLGIALLATYVLMLSITISILGIAVGNYFASKFKNKTKAKTILLSFASVTVIWLLQLVPYIGTYVSTFTIVFGLGLILFALFSKKATDNTEVQTENN